MANYRRRSDKRSAPSPGGAYDCYRRIFRASRAKAAAHHRDSALDALLAITELRVLLDNEERKLAGYARRLGATWPDIGDALAISKQAAQQRFAPKGQF